MANSAKDYVDLCIVNTVYKVFVCIYYFFVLRRNKITQSKFSKWFAFLLDSRKENSTKIVTDATFNEIKFEIL